MHMDMSSSVKRAAVLAALIFGIGNSGAQEIRELPPGGPRGPGRPGPDGDVFAGGPQRAETKLVKQFDKDRDSRLNADERKAAREWLAKERAEGRALRGFGGPRGRRPGGFRENEEPPKPGAKLAPADVAPAGGAPLYDAGTLRTLFLDFENADWEQELADFNNTDVEVPARLTVDGKTYPDVGVHFRGASSFFSVSPGRKRPLNLSLDFVNEKQNLLGYRTLNLLNSHGDPTFLRAVLYYHIAREYLPAPKANFVRVAINGENWGVYINAQQFNKEFIKEWFGTTKGSRWKVPGSPGGRGSLAYLGEEVDEYKRFYEIKSKDKPEAWKDLIRLCKVLNETPAERLEKELAPLLNIDGALRFLALENALINNDGYWARTSDYSLYRDASGKFHVFPHDANETFVRAGGPGFRGRGGPGRPGPAGADGAGPREPGADGAPERPRGRGPGGGMGPGGGVKLDPLVAANDPNKPLISKLLAVPSLREKYLGYVREIAEKWLDWRKLGPIAERYQQVISAEVNADTRKLDSFEAFTLGMTEEVRGSGFGPGGGAKIGLKNFADERRAFLLEHPALTSK